MENTAALNNVSLREKNRGLVFKLIAVNDGISRTEIAQQSGLTKMAVSYIITEFLQRNLVVETEYTGDRKLARKPVILRLSPSAPKVVGVLIHRTHISAVLCDCSLGVLRSQTLRIRDYTCDSLMEQVFRVTDAVMAGQRVIGIGIGSVGPVDVENGVILNPPDFCGIRDLPVAKLMQERYGIPAYLDYHYNCAALAESLFGVGASYRNFIFLGISDGLGAGIVTDGKLFSSFTGYSGEIGHISVDFRGPKCFCGNRGCFGTALRLDVSGPEEIDMIATTMGGICNLLNPQAIIIGDEQARWDKDYLRALEDAVNGRLLTKEYRHVDILPSYRSKDLEASGGAMNVVSKIFDGKLLFDSEA